MQYFINLDVFKLKNMKKLNLILFCILISFGLFSQNMNFESTVVDYGVIKHKTDGQRVFKFTNDGDKPLIISN